LGRGGRMVKGEVAIKRGGKDREVEGGLEL